MNGFKPSYETFKVGAPLLHQGFSQSRDVLRAETRELEYAVSEKASHLAFHFDHRKRKTINPGRAGRMLYKEVNVFKLSGETHDWYKAQR